MLASSTQRGSRTATALEILAAAIQRLEAHRPVPINLLDDIVRFFALTDAAPPLPGPIDRMARAVERMRRGVTRSVEAFLRGAHEHCAATHVLSSDTTSAAERALERVVATYDRRLADDCDSPDFFPTSGKSPRHSRR